MKLTIKDLFIILIMLWMSDVFCVVTVSDWKHCWYNMGTDFVDLFCVYLYCTLYKGKN
jgi:hypothetical protein